MFREESGLRSRSVYTEEEAGQIRKLLKLKKRAMASELRSLQAHLRRLGFYISDFDASHTGFGPEDFNRLIGDGTLQVSKPEDDKVGA
jgi:hypothetical protein